MDWKATTAKEVIRRDLDLSLIRDDLDEVEKILLDQVASEVALVNQVGRHLLNSGGKRFRPCLVLLSSRLFGHEGRDSLVCAAAVEYAHAATLLHDDVIDEATCRRGRPSANRLFGNKASVLVGDYLLFQGFQLVMRLRNMRILDVINKTAVRMAEGETKELENLGNLNLDEVDYFSVITNKTAILIQASAQIGAILGSADPSQEKCLSDFGLNVGIAFQLVDDALDYTADESQWGKKVGKDFHETKPTLPLLHSYASGSDTARSRMEKFFKKRCRVKSDFSEVLGYISGTDSINYTLNKAGDYIEQAKRNLDSFPDSEPKRALLAIADYIVERRI